MSELIVFVVAIGLLVALVLFGANRLCSDVEDAHASLR